MRVGWLILFFYGNPNGERFEMIERILGADADKNPITIPDCLVKYKQ